MRILLVLDRVENPASANALMGFRLAEQLLHRDHTVHILTLWDGLHMLLSKVTLFGILRIMLSPLRVTLTPVPRILSRSFASCTSM